MTGIGESAVAIGKAKKSIAAQGFICELVIIGALFYALRRFLTSFGMLDVFTRIA